MKLKYITFIYTIFILLIMGIIIHSFSASVSVDRDMVYYNEQVQLILKEIRNGVDREDIESKYSCSILYISDDVYSTNLNEILKKDALLIDLYDEGTLIGKAAWGVEAERYEAAKRKLTYRVTGICFLVLCGGYLLIILIYMNFIRPFKELQEFSSFIAKGNLDIGLPVHKNNFFGAFTESFDIMREELKKARENEYKANRSKRELVAELSHDIKTPVSTIKATCEVLQIKEKNNDTLDKLCVIMAKADTIDRLIGNMFHATLEELDVLKVEAQEESSLCIKEMFDKLKYYGEIIFDDNVPECLIYIDKLRFEQVIDNIVNNSYKYAGTSVYINVIDLDNRLKIVIRDTGNGIPEDELVLVAGKYYRGSNAKGKSGSGLGLYLSKFFIEQMGGEIDCYNQNGFVVELILKKV